MGDETTEIWVDGSYLKNSMGGGYVAIYPDGRRVEKSFAIPTKEWDAGSITAEFMAAVTALSDYANETDLEIFCDCQQVVDSINDIRNSRVPHGKTKFLQEALQSAMSGRDIRASHASEHQQYIAKAHDLAQAGAAKGKKRRKSRHRSLAPRHDG